MSAPFRVWILFSLLICTLAMVIGIQPHLSGLWWPLPGLWAAAAWSAFGLSIYTAFCLTGLGLITDFIMDAPLGSWALGLVSAYGAGVLAWAFIPPTPRTFMLSEALAVAAGMLALILAIKVANSVAGGGSPVSSLFPHLFVTALLYPLARFVMVPGGLRELFR